MLLFELVMLTSSLLVVWVYCESKRMGLHADIPPDPAGRSRLYASELLHWLKDEFCQARILQIGGPWIRYIGKDGQTRQLWPQDGCLWLCVGDQPRQAVHSIGGSGRLDFRVNDSGWLSLDVVVAREPGYPHQFSLRLQPLGPSVRGGWKLNSERQRLHWVSSEMQDH